MSIYIYSLNLDTATLYQTVEPPNEERQKNLEEKCQVLDRLRMQFFICRVVALILKIIIDTS